MKNIVTGTDMKKVDSYTINTIGIPSLVLMERAALSVAEIVCKNQLKDKKILVVAGVGNNGADGVAICRILHLKGYNTELYIYVTYQKPVQNLNSSFPLHIILELT